MIEKQINNKIRKVFLDELPRKNNKIDWKNSIGYIVHFIYDNIEGDIQIIDYKASYLTVVYKEREKVIRSNSLLIGKLGYILGKRTSEFKVEIGEVFQDKTRDITIIDRKIEIDTSGIKRKYCKYKCNRDNYESWILEFSLLKGIGCACCSNRFTIKGVNDVATTHPYLTKYFVNIDDAYKYSYASGKKAWMKCPDCGAIKYIEISTLYRYGISCSKCSDKISYPNKFGFNLLEQLQIDFETEYNPEWIKPKRYDFYFELNDKKYIIEMDGGFHNKDNNLSGQTKEESKVIDDEKDRLARLHGIEVIRINCAYSNIETRFEYIKNSIIQNNKLNRLFDLSEINWLEIDKYACSSLIKVACEYWKVMPDATQIAKIMKIHRNTILKYLKIGATKFNWCDYNPKKIQNEAHSKVGKLSGKKVEIFKDEISLGIFPSCMELERQSEKLFGVKLGNSMIAQVCKDKRKQYKGFTFKYI